MKLTFIPDGNIVFAVAQNQRYAGLTHEELLFAEIETKGNVSTIRWNDSFFTPESLPMTAKDAERYVTQNHLEHEPTSNGKKW